MKKFLAALFTLFLYFAVFPKFLFSAGFENGYPASVEVTPNGPVNLQTIKVVVKGRLQLPRRLCGFNPTLKYGELPLEIPV